MGFSWKVQLGMTALIKCMLTIGSVSLLLQGGCTIVHASRSHCNSNIVELLLRFCVYAEHMHLGLALHTNNDMAFRGAGKSRYYHLLPAGLVFYTLLLDDVSEAL